MSNIKPDVVFVVQNGVIVHQQLAGPINERRELYIQLRRAYGGSSIWVGLVGVNRPQFVSWRHVTFLFDQKGYNVRKVFGADKNFEDVPEIIRMGVLMGAICPSQTT